MSADSRTVTTTVPVSSSPERVLRAFVDPDDLRGWWKVSRSLAEDRPGGVWSVAWDDFGEERTHHAWVGVVEERAPRRLLVAPLVMIEPQRPLFGPMRLEVVATPAAVGTSLTVSHHGYRRGEHWDWIHDAVVVGWRHVLADLREWLASP